MKAFVPEALETTAEKVKRYQAGCQSNGPKKDLKMVFMQRDTGGFHSISAISGRMHRERLARCLYRAKIFPSYGITCFV